VQQIIDFMKISHLRLRGTGVSTWYLRSYLINIVHMYGFVKRLAKERSRLQAEDNVTSLILQFPLVSSTTGRAT